jgi:hypothetical protein
MPIEVDFGSRDAANDIRDEFESALTGRYDRRHKTVEVVDSARDDIKQEIELAAADSRAGESQTFGQTPLTDGEKEKIDFSKDGANVFHARRAKSILQGKHGISDWISYYDPQVASDGFDSIAERAKRGGASGGKRRDPDHDPVEKAAEHARSAQSSRCDHARGHCANGDPDACEFLTERCSYDDAEVSALMGADESGESDAESDEASAGGGMTGEEMGALRRSWGGYEAAVNDLERLLSEAQEAFENAQQAFAAINAIRDRHDQAPLTPERLEEIKDSDFLDLACECDHDSGESPLAEREPSRSRAPQRPPEAQRPSESRVRELREAGMERLRELEEQMDRANMGDADGTTIRQAGEDATALAVAVGELKGPGQVTVEELDAVERAIADAGAAMESLADEGIPIDDRAQQGTLAVGEQTRAGNDIESRTAAEQGSLMADDRSSPSRGAGDGPDGGEQADLMGKTEDEQREDNQAALAE